MHPVIRRFGVHVSVTALSGLPRHPGHRTTALAAGAGLTVLFLAGGFFLYLAVTAPRLRDVLSGAGGARWVVVLLIFVLGWALFRLRRTALVFYALLELGFAFGIALDAARVPSDAPTLAVALKLVGAMYVVVRGLDNWSKAFEELRTATAGTPQHALRQMMPAATQ